MKYEKYKICFFVAAKIVPSPEKSYKSYALKRLQTKKLQVIPFLYEKVTNHYRTFCMQKL